MNALAETNVVEMPLPSATNPSGFMSTAALVMNSESLAQMGRMAEMMAQSRVTVPKHLQGNAGDCLAVVMQAMQWGMNPFAVAQKTHLVNGTLGYEAQLVNAVVQSMGAITGHFRYEYKGEGQSGFECRVGAVIRGDHDITWGEWLHVASVQVKNSPLWKTNPRQQMGYLQVKNWARAYAPGAVLGVYTVDELHEAITQEKDVTPGSAMKPTEPVERPHYTDEQFNSNRATWQKLINDGKQTPDRIISMVSSKYQLSEYQRREILNLNAIDGIAAPVMDDFVTQMEAAESEAPE